MIGRLDLAVGVAEAEVFEEGKEGGELVMLGVCWGAYNEKCVEGREQGDVEM